MWNFVKQLATAAASTSLNAPSSSPSLITSSAHPPHPSHTPPPPPSSVEVGVGVGGVGRGERRTYFPSPPPSASASVSSSSGNKVRGSSGGRLAKEETEKEREVEAITVSALHAIPQTDKNENRKDNLLSAASPPPLLSLVSLTSKTSNIHDANAAHTVMMNCSTSATAPTRRKIREEEKKEDEHPPKKPPFFFRLERVPIPLRENISRVPTWGISDGPLGPSAAGHVRNSCNHHHNSGNNSNSSARHDVCSCGSEEERLNQEVGMEEMWRNRSSCSFYSPPPSHYNKEEGRKEENQKKEAKKEDEEEKSSIFASHLAVTCVAAAPEEQVIVGTAGGEVFWYASKKNGATTVLRPFLADDDEEERNCKGGNRKRRRRSIQATTTSSISHHQNQGSCSTAAFPSLTCSSSSSFPLPPPSLDSLVPIFHFSGIHRGYVIREISVVVGGRGGGKLSSRRRGACNASVSLTRKDTSRMESGKNILSFPSSSFSSSSRSSSLFSKEGGEGREEDEREGGRRDEGRGEGEGRLGTHSLPNPNLPLLPSSSVPIMYYVAVADDHHGISIHSMRAAKNDDDDEEGSWRVSPCEGYEMRFEPDANPKIQYSSNTTRSPNNNSNHNTKIIERMKMEYDCRRTPSRSSSIKDGAPLRSIALHPLYDGSASFPCVCARGPQVIALTAPLLSPISSFPPPCSSSSSSATSTCSSTSRSSRRTSRSEERRNWREEEYTRESSASDDENNTGNSEEEDCDRECMRYSDSIQTIHHHNKNTTQHNNNNNNNNNDNVGKGSGGGGEGGRLISPPEMEILWSSSSSSSNAMMRMMMAGGGGRAAAEILQLRFRPLPEGAQKEYSCGDAHYHHPPDNNEAEEERKGGERENTSRWRKRVDWPMDLHILLVWLTSDLEAMIYHYTSRQVLRVLSFSAFSVSPPTPFPSSRRAPPFSTDTMAASRGDYQQRQSGGKDGRREGEVLTMEGGQEKVHKEGGMRASSKPTTIPFSTERGRCFPPLPPPPPPPLPMSFRPFCTALEWESFARLIINWGTCVQVVEVEKDFISSPMLLFSSTTTTTTPSPIPDRLGTPKNGEKKKDEEEEKEEKTKDASSSFPFSPPPQEQEEEETAVRTVGQGRSSLLASSLPFSSSSSHLRFHREHRRSREESKKHRNSPHLYEIKEKKEEKRIVQDGHPLRSSSIPPSLHPPRDRPTIISPTGKGSGLIFSWWLRLPSGGKAGKGGGKSEGEVKYEIRLEAIQPRAPVTWHCEVPHSSSHEQERVEGCNELIYRIVPFGVSSYLMMSIHLSIRLSEPQNSDEKDNYNHNHNNRRNADYMGTSKRSSGTSHAINNEKEISNFGAGRGGIVESGGDGGGGWTTIGAFSGSSSSTSAFSSSSSPPSGLLTWEKEKKKENKKQEVDLIRWWRWWEMERRSWNRKKRRVGPKEEGGQEDEDEKNFEWEQVEASSVFFSVAPFVCGVSVKIVDRQTLQQQPATKKPGGESGVTFPTSFLLSSSLIGLGFASYVPPVPRIRVPPPPPPLLSSSSSCCGGSGSSFSSCGSFCARRDSPPDKSLSWREEHEVCLAQQLEDHFPPYRSSFVIQIFHSVIRVLPPSPMAKVNDLLEECEKNWLGEGAHEDKDEKRTKKKKNKKINNEKDQGGRIMNDADDARSSSFVSSSYSPPSSSSTPTSPPPSTPYASSFSFSTPPPSSSCSPTSTRANTDSSSSSGVVASAKGDQDKNRKKKSKNKKECSTAAIVAGGGVMENELSLPRAFICAEQAFRLALAYLQRAGGVQGRRKRKYERSMNASRCVTRNKRIWTGTASRRSNWTSNVNDDHSNDEHHYYDDSYSRCRARLLSPSSPSSGRQILEERGGEHSENEKEESEEKFDINDPERNGDESFSCLQQQGAVALLSALIILWDIKWEWTLRCARLPEAEQEEGDVTHITSLAAAPSVIPILPSPTSSSFSILSNFSWEMLLQYLQILLKEGVAQLPSCSCSSFSLPLPPSAPIEAIVALRSGLPSFWPALSTREDDDNADDDTSSLLLFLFLLRRTFGEEVGDRVFTQLCLSSCSSSSSSFFSFSFLNFLLPLPPRLYTCSKSDEDGDAMYSHDPRANVEADDDEDEKGEEENDNCSKKGRKEKKISSSHGLGWWSLWWRWLRYLVRVGELWRLVDVLPNSSNSNNQHSQKNNKISSSSSYGLRWTLKRKRERRGSRRKERGEKREKNNSSPLLPSAPREISPAEDIDGCRGIKHQQHVFSSSSFSPSSQEGEKVSERKEEHSYMEKQEPYIPLLFSCSHDHGHEKKEDTDFTPLRQSKDFYLIILLYCLAFPRRGKEEEERGRGSFISFRRGIHRFASIIDLEKMAQAVLFCIRMEEQKIIVESEEEGENDKEVKGGQREHRNKNNKVQNEQKHYYQKKELEHPQNDGDTSTRVEKYGKKKTKEKEEDWEKQVYPSHNNMCNNNNDDDDDDDDEKDGSRCCSLFPPLKMRERRNVLLIELWDLYAEILLHREKPNDALQVMLSNPGSRLLFSYIRSSSFLQGLLSSSPSPSPSLSFSLSSFTQEHVRILFYDHSQSETIDWLWECATWGEGRKIGRRKGRWGDEERRRGKSPSGHPLDAIANFAPQRTGKEDPISGTRRRRREGDEEDEKKDPATSSSSSFPPVLDLPVMELNVLYEVLWSQDKECLWHFLQRLHRESHYWWWRSCNCDHNNRNTSGEGIQRATITSGTSSSGGDDGVAGRRTITSITTNTKTTSTTAPVVYSASWTSSSPSPPVLHCDDRSHSQGEFPTPSPSPFSSSFPPPPLVEQKKKEENDRRLFPSCSVPFPSLQVVSSLPLPPPPSSYPHLPDAGDFQGPHVSLCSCCCFSSMLKEKVQLFLKAHAKEIIKLCIRFGRPHDLLFLLQGEHKSVFTPYCDVLSLWIFSSASFSSLPVMAENLLPWTIVDVFLLARSKKEKEGLRCCLAKFRSPQLALEYIKHIPRRMRHGPPSHESVRKRKPEVEKAGLALSSLQKKKEGESRNGNNTSIMSHRDGGESRQMAFHSFPLSSFWRTSGEERRMMRGKKMTMMTNHEYFHEEKCYTWKDVHEGGEDDEEKEWDDHANRNTNNDEEEDEEGEEADWGERVLESEEETEARREMLFRELTDLCVLDYVGEEHSTASPSSLGGILHFSTSVLDTYESVAAAYRCTPEEVKLATRNDEYFRKALRGYYVIQKNGEDEEEEREKGVPKRFSFRYVPHQGKKGGQRRRGSVKETFSDDEEEDDVWGRSKCRGRSKEEEETYPEMSSSSSSPPYFVIPNSHLCTALLVALTGTPSSFSSSSSFAAGVGAGGASSAADSVSSSSPPLPPRGTGSAHAYSSSLPPGHGPHHASKIVHPRPPPAPPLLHSSASKVIPSHLEQKLSKTRRTTGEKNGRIHATAPHTPSSRTVVSLLYSSPFPFFFFFCSSSSSSSTFGFRSVSYLLSQLTRFSVHVPRLPHYFMVLLHEGEIEAHFYENIHQVLQQDTHRNYEELYFRRRSAVRVDPTSTTCPVCLLPLCTEGREEYVGFCGHIQHRECVGRGTAEEMFRLHRKRYTAIHRWFQIEEEGGASRIPFPRELQQQRQGEEDEEKEKVNNTKTEHDSHEEGGKKDARLLPGPSSLGKDVREEVEQVVVVRGKEDDADVSFRNRNRFIPYCCVCADGWKKEKK